MEPSGPGQKPNRDESSAGNPPKDALREDEWGGSFISLDDISGFSEKLKSEEEKILGSRDTPETERQESDEYGTFLSPEEMHGSRSKPAAPSSAGVNSEFFTKISTELKSIRSELASLKSGYEGGEKRQALAQGEEAAAKADGGAATKSAVLEEEGFTMGREAIQDLKKLLVYMDRLLESLPEEKVDEFARSEYFDLYRKIFEFFGLD